VVQTKRDYALSETKWLSEVPADWRPFRLKEVAKVSPSFSGNGPGVNEDCSIIPMEVVTEKGAFNDYDVQAYDLVTSGLTNFENGDVIFAKITPCMENGKGKFVEGLKTKYAFGSTEFHVFRPNGLIDGKFLYYYTYDPEYRKYAAENMTGAAGQKRVSTRFIAYTSVFLPDILEQRNIVTYLDKQCAAIDKVLQAKREQLTVLEDLRKSIIHKAVTKGLDDSAEMKDSGIEWIGKMPKKWKVDRIKDVVSLRNTKTDEKDEIENYIELEDMDQKTGRLLSMRNTIGVESDVILFEKGDVLFGKLRPYLEKHHYAEMNGKCTGEIFAFKPERIQGKYFYYCVASPWFISRCDVLSYGAKMPRVNWPTQIAVMDMPTPSYNEQIDIAEFLDKEIKGIFSLMDNIKQQIDILEEYRKSLVHECVTGKRRITEEDLKELANV